MLDKTGKVIYVGAATDLKQRVSSYFRRDIPDFKTRKLVADIRSFDYEIHETREAAFIRERELIRIYHPRYNRMWMDDKDYPFLQITVPTQDEKFSRLFIVRSILNSHDWFFGRKKDTSALRSSVRVLRRIFPLANKTYCFRTKKPCLDYSIKRCSAPCVDKISLEEYQKIVDEFILFLKGKRKDLLDLLYEEMNQQAKDLNYEGAAKTRDRILQIERTIGSQEKQMTLRDKDIIILLFEEKHYLLLNFLIKNNEIMSFQSKDLGYLNTLSTSEILASYVQNYYLESEFIPPIIETSHELGEDTENLETWFSKKQGNLITINHKPEALEAPLLKPIILKNRFKLGEHIRKLKKRKELQKEAMSDLQLALHLDRLPLRIETYDISTLQGQYSVGSMVVFTDGLPDKSQYRRFRIKASHDQSDDVGMMREVLTRRLKHKDTKFASQLPDLIVIDGGKPQVNAIGKILRTLDIKIPLIGLAKREEEVFLPQARNPIIFDPNGAALRLLKQTRDEAHRFAITYHKKLRVLKPKSDLDNIPGVGIKRREALLKYFGSIDKIKIASVEELCQVPGISRSVGEKIFLHYNSNPNIGD
jgi:excinuclease ABC subunit C